jgi:hypothetical protein
MNKWILFLILFSLFLVSCENNSENNNNNTAPVFISEPIENAKIGIEYEYIIQVSDADNDSLIIQLEEGPSWLILTDSVLSGIPLNVDRNDIVISVSDGKKKTQQTFKIRISSNLPPYVSEISSIVDMNYGQTLKFSFDVIDPENELITVQFNEKPSFVSFDDVSFEFTINPDQFSFVGNHEVKFTIRDGINEIEKSFDIKVHDTFVKNIDKWSTYNSLLKNNKVFYTYTSNNNYTTIYSRDLQGNLLSTIPLDVQMSGSYKELHVSNNENFILQTHNGFNLNPSIYYFNSVGNIQWSINDVDTTGIGTSSSITISENEGVIYSYAHHSDSLILSYVRSLSKDGNILWEKTYEYQHNKFGKWINLIYQFKEKLLLFANKIVNGVSVINITELDLNGNFLNEVDLMETTIALNRLKYNQFENTFTISSAGYSNALIIDADTYSSKGIHRYANSVIQGNYLYYSRSVKNEFELILYQKSLVTDQIKEIILSTEYNRKIPPDYLLRIDENHMIISFSRLIGGHFRNDVIKLSIDGHFFE